MGRAAAAFGRREGLSSAACHRLLVAGRFHDLGKAAVDRRLLAKPGELSAHERGDVAHHVVAGGEMLGEDPPPWLLDAVVLHHERWDGAGHFGLRGTSIPLVARVIALADVYDALRSRRSYKPSIGPCRALLVMLSEPLRGTFDPCLLNRFVTAEMRGLHPEDPDLAELAEAAGRAPSVALS